jgi:hypothetical protein
MSYKQKQANIKERLKSAKKGILIWISSDIYRQSGVFKIKGDTFYNTLDNRKTMIDRGARSVKLEGELDL